MTAISELLTTAVDHHRAGRLPAAEQIYRQVLAIEPNNADAWNLLGAAYLQSSNYQIALDCIGRAIELNPGAAEFHGNLGNVYQKLKKPDQAIACYGRALELKPGFVEAHNNLGTVLRAQGMRGEAIACYRRALELKPDHAEAHFNLGIALREQGQCNEAVVCYRRALELRPEFAEAHNNLGTALRAQGMLDEAVACYNRALELQPELAHAHNNLGNVFQERREFDSAVMCYRRALELKPEFAEAHNNLGTVLREYRHLDDAIACYRRALELKPDYAEAHSNLGIALQDCGKRNEAVICYRRALELTPNFAEAFQNLGTVLHELGMLDEAATCYRRAVELKPNNLSAVSVLVHELQNLCDWNDVSALSQRVVESVDDDGKQATTAAVLPFAFLALPAITTARQQHRCASRWADRQLRLPVELGRRFSFSRPSTFKSKLAIGYLSADFHSHATSMLIAELLEKHDRDRFAVCGYSYGPSDGSSMRQRLIRAFDRFADLKDASILNAAERIAGDEVDILVDLKGYTTNARAEISALRPAPIQVNYLGYPGTMGASFMDYILVDDFIVPPGQQPFFTEKLVHLPGCYQVNDSQREIAPYTPSRTECGLPEKGFVFCCFNNNYKITPEVFDAWMKLLKAIPGSVLWLLESNRFAPDNLRREAESRGVAAQRLVFAPRVELAEHLARHRLADLFLDTFPVNAHTTASDALWAGCPVLTIAGETFVSRVAGSLLCTLGLPELVTTNLREYEALALQLARDTTRLALVRGRLQANRTSSGVFNGERFARTLEKAYVTMWQICVQGEQPRALRVNPN